MSTFRGSEQVNGAANRIWMDMVINPEAILASPCLHMTFSVIPKTK